MSYVIPIAYFDAPKVIDCSITPIPASASLPLQVIANTGLNLGVGMNYSDSTGDFIGIYIGAAGFETLACIIGNGVASQAWGQFPPNSRVSLRSMKNAVITGGLLTGVVVTV
jgi:hypothetical protein